MKILSIDPSIATVGVAIIENGSYKNSYTIRTDMDGGIVGRLGEIHYHFKNIWEPYDAVLVEEPDSFMRIGNYSIKNVASIQLLEMAIGAIIVSLSDRYHMELVRVREWKGHQNKKVTQMIAEKHAGKKLNDHESDALVMAMNWERYIKIRQLTRGINGVKKA